MTPEEKARVKIDQMFYDAGRAGWHHSAEERQHQQGSHAIAGITKRNRRMNEIEKKENKIILYKDEEGKLSVNTLFCR